MKKVVICTIYAILCLLIYIKTDFSKSVTISKIDYDSKPFTEIEKVDEKSEWINIPTYEESGEVTHPKVIYQNKGINGYKYWMVSTPYPFNDAYYENPSITVSNDGTNFIEPDGIKNPVSGFSDTYNDNSYYSDPFMLYNGSEFELFYRKTKSIDNDKYIKDGFNYMIYQTSKDGISWSEKEYILLNNPPERYMSMSVVKQGNLYKIWYINYDGVIRYIESADLKNFSKPISVKVNDFNKFIWHGEIQYVDGKYVLVLLIRYKLYYSESVDGINFDRPKLIDTNLDELNGTIHHIYKSSFIIDKNKVELFVPIRVNYVWKMRHFVFEKENFYNFINKKEIN